jgi:hypothetical protein
VIYLDAALPPGPRRRHVWAAKSRCDRDVLILGFDPGLESVDVDIYSPLYADDRARVGKPVTTGLENPPAKLILREWTIRRELGD